MNNNKDIVVVGSVAFDNIETVKGKRERLLGGSGVYFSLAASLFTKIHLIGIVGEDFDSSYIDMLNSKSISTENLIIESGQTFSWGGKYSNDFSHRDTLFTELGVFENFKPQINNLNVEQPILFLANIQPCLQMDVIDKIHNPSLVVMDTMNLWIDNDFQLLMKVIKKTDILLINDEEAIQLTNIDNLHEAGKLLLGQGLKYVIIKQGGEGALIISDSNIKHIPAIPNIDVFDPTGAGDSFAGGFLGHIASNKNFDITDAVIYGTAIASYTVSAFGINGIKNLQLNNIKNRIKLLYDLIEGS